MAQIKQVIEQLNKEKLIRQDSLLGGNKVIVGNTKQDLVLETLGKVYVKYANNFKLLNDLFDLLNKTDETDTTKVITVDSDSALEELTYPGDGYFIYNTLSKVLYISFNGSYVAIANAEDYGKYTEYVKKTGDTMTGALEIKTPGAPLIVTSRSEVSNLNSNYIEGYSADELAKKRVDEYITGNWTFNGKGVSENTWEFRKNTRHYGDTVTSGSITTPQFESGFAGSGWRIDGDTNTMTIDYLVVRKAMKVYELVINKISATNGSLWVANSSKCDAAVQPIITTITNSTTITYDSTNKIISGLTDGTYYIFEDSYYDTSSNSNTTTTTIQGVNLSSSNSPGQDTQYKTYRYLYYICDVQGLTQNINFTGLDSILNTKNVIDNLFNYIRIYNIEDFGVDYNSYFYAYVEGQKLKIYSYYKYFGYSSSNNFWVIDTDKDEFPLFKVGDIIRCQKFDGSSIKYYDALVVRQLESRKYLMQKALSVFDTYTNIQYNSDGSIKSYETKYNTTQYSKTNTQYIGYSGETKYNNSTYGDYSSGTYNESTELDNPAAGDDMIQMGSITDPSRQNAIYLTSTDDQGPYIDIISGLNRPDYSVIYNIPKFVTYKKVVNNKIGLYYVSTTSGGVDLGQLYVNDITHAIQESEAAGYTKTQLYGYILPEDGTLVEQDKNGSPIYNYTKSTRVRVGNLSGIYNTQFGNDQPHGFGLYGENVYLTGEFYLNNGSAVARIADDIILTLNGAGLTIKEIDGKSRLVLDADKIYINNNGTNALLIENGKISNDLLHIKSIMFYSSKFLESYDIFEKNVKRVCEYPLSSINEDNNGLRKIYYPPIYKYTDGSGQVKYQSDDESTYESILKHNTYKQIDGSVNVTNSDRTVSTYDATYVSQMFMEEKYFYDYSGSTTKIVGVEVRYYDTRGNLTTSKKDWYPSIVTGGNMVTNTLTKLNVNSTDDSELYTFITSSHSSLPKITDIQDKLDTYLNNVLALSNLNSIPYPESDGSITSYSDINTLLAGQKPIFGNVLAYDTIIYSPSKGFTLYPELPVEDSYFYSKGYPDSNGNYPLASIGIYIKNNTLKVESTTASTSNSRKVTGTAELFVVVAYTKSGTQSASTESTSSSTIDYQPNPILNGPNVTTSGTYAYGMYYSKDINLQTKQ